MITANVPSLGFELCFSTSVVVMFAIETDDWAIFAVHDEDGVERVEWSGRGSMNVTAPILENIRVNASIRRATPDAVAYTLSYEATPMAFGREIVMTGAATGVRVVNDDAQTTVLAFRHDAFPTYLGENKSDVLRLVTRSPDRPALAEISAGYGYSSTSAHGVSAMGLHGNLTIPLGPTLVEYTRVRTILPSESFEMQAAFSSGTMSRYWIVSDAPFVNVSVHSPEVRFYRLDDFAGLNARVGTVMVARDGELAITESTPSFLLAVSASDWRGQGRANLRTIDPQNVVHEGSQIFDSAVNRPAGEEGVWRVRFDEVTGFEDVRHRVIAMSW